MSLNAKLVCVIIGGSHAGVNLSFSLRREGWEGEIILYEKEISAPYHKPPLSKTYITEKEDVNELLKPIESYEKEKIHLALGITVNEIDRKNRQVLLSDGTTQHYDKLVIATGARPLIPPIKGIHEAQNLFPIRTAADARNIRNAINHSEKKRVVIIGGGYIGLETAASLKKTGAEVTILERENDVLARVTAPHMSAYFRKLHKDHGVSILTGKNVASIDNDDGINVVSCDDGSAYLADIVVVGVGIRINTELAEKAGLTIENGIRVDSSSKTNDDHIYAVGDCTNHYNPHYQRYIRLESVQNAVDQGKIAAAAICGKEVVYNSIPWFWSDQYDVKLQMVGLSAGYDEIIVRQEDTMENSFSIWYFKNEELLAVDAVNNGKAYVLGTRFIKGGQKIDKEKLKDSDIPMKPTTFLMD